MGLLSFIGEAASSVGNALLGDLGGSALGMVGGLLGNKSSASEAAKSRKASIEAAKNSHQWEVADLIKAGLNPILSANSGASLSSLPSAGQANPFQGVGDTINSANKINNIDKKIAESTIDLQKQSALNQEEQAGAATAQKHLHETTEQLTAENRENAREQRAVIRQQADLVRAQAAREQAGAILNSAQALESMSRTNLVDKQAQLTDFDLGAREYGKQVERYTEPANKVIDTIGSGLDTINPIRAFRTPKPRRRRP